MSTQSILTSVSNHTPFIRALQQLFVRQARDFMSHLTPRQIQQGVDLSHWLPGMLESLRPFMLRPWQTGMVQSMQHIGQQLNGSGYRSQLFARKSLRNVVLKVAKHPGVGLNFDLFNPKVLSAVDAAVMQFCRETNATATTELNQALADLRASLKEGLSQGEALADLGNRVRNIFADPSRAFRIAQTEIVRAQAAGRMMAAKESGVVVAKRWMATGGGMACDACDALDLKQVPLDEPFIILPKGGPYSVVMHPPLHPHCRCDVQEVLGKVKPAVTVPTGVPRPVPKFAFVLTPTNLAGAHPPNPWNIHPDHPKQTVDRLKADEDAKAKRKVIMTTENAHQKVLDKVAKEQAEIKSQMKKLDDEGVALTKKILLKEGNLTEHALRLKQIADGKRPLWSTSVELTKQSSKVRKDWKADNENRLKEVFKVSDPVLVKPTIVNFTMPEPLKKKITEVCGLLSAIIGKSAVGESEISVPFYLIPSSAEQRDYQAKGKVYLTHGADKKTIAHEMGHALEHLFPAYAKMVRAFWKARCGKDKPILLAKFGKRYGINEVGYEDKFGKVLGKGTAEAAYTGKTYKGGETEITAMGLQLLFEDPKKFAKEDPQWFALITGMLKGNYR